MPYIAQMVHFEYGGKCNAAILSAFWEDQDLAQLTVMRQAGGQPWVVSRAPRGNYGDDQHWHTLAECPDVAMEAPATAADIPVVAVDPDPLPVPEVQPKRRGRKPKSDQGA